MRKDKKMKVQVICGFQDAATGASYATGQVVAGVDEGKAKHWAGLGLVMVMAEEEIGSGLPAGNPDEVAPMKKGGMAQENKKGGMAQEDK